MTAEQKLANVRKLIEAMEKGFSERRTDVADILGHILVYMDSGSVPVYRLKYESRMSYGTFEYAGETFEIHYDTLTTLLRWRRLTEAEDENFAMCSMDYADEPEFFRIRESLLSTWYRVWLPMIHSGVCICDTTDKDFAQAVLEKANELCQAANYPNNAYIEEIER